MNCYEQTLSASIDDLNQRGSQMLQTLYEKHRYYQSYYEYTQKIVEMNQVMKSYYDLKAVNGVIPATLKNKIKKFKIETFTYIPRDMDKNHMIIIKTGNIYIDYINYTNWINYFHYQYNNEIKNIQRNKKQLEKYYNYQIQLYSNYQENFKY
jgi:hypothetical protein